MSTLEGIEVAFTLGHFQRFNLLDVLTAILVLKDSDEFETYGIVKPLFVDDILESVPLAREYVALNHVFGFLVRHNVDAVPTGGYQLFPCSDVLGLLVVVGKEHLATLCEWAVELCEVVVELTLHRVVRCNLCDRVLHCANPSLGIALRVASIVERQDFILQQ